MVTSLVEKSTSRAPEDCGGALHGLGEHPRTRILVLATDIFTRGGIARYTATLASSLGGVVGSENVDVLCFFDWGSDSEQARGLRVRGMVSGGTRASLWSRLRFLVEVARAGMRGYDLVIANHIALAPVAAAMKLFWGTPYWVACHCVEVWWGTSRWRQAALKHADMILPVSRYTAGVVRKMNGIRESRVRVLYNAIPNSFADLVSGPEEGSAAKFKSDNKVLLSVCSLAPGNEFKGVDTVLRALPEIFRVLPDARYVVVGEGAIRKNLENLAAEIGVAKKVEFAGEVTDAELAAFYRSCDVFVLPSRGKGQGGRAAGEGFGRVYVEAALAAKPVVGSRSGGAAEAVLPGRTGFLVDPDSKDDVAQAVLTILQDPQLAARMGSEGRRWALEEFSEKTLSRELRELLEPYGSGKEGVATLAPHCGGQL